MQIPLNLINDFASITGIGALCLLGIFLIVDGKEPNLFPTIEFYAKTKTWALVAIVPVFAISYVVGLFSVVIIEPIGNFLFSQFHSEIIESENLAMISFFDSEILKQEFIRLNKEKELLYGSTLAFLLIGLGGLSETRNLPNLKKIILLGVFCAAIVSLSSLYVATQKRLKSNEIVLAAQKVETSNFNIYLERKIEEKKELLKLDTSYTTRE
ncbi:MAG: hypothetical protein R2824_12740 [Saprospiraceae bacterium]|nr:hypothetical protein [Lewinella sp.]